MNHVNETTFLLMTNVILELTSMVRAKQACPGPLTHDQQVSLRKADEVRQMALREAQLAGILPPAPPGPKS